jgi:hypothetical protein
MSRPSRVAPAALLVAVAFAAGVVSAMTLAGDPVNAAPVARTAALGDVVVRQGAHAVFRYRVDGASARPVSLELRISCNGRRIVTVHLGKRRPGTSLHQTLAIGLAPGRYVWTVVPDDPLAVSSAVAARLLVT